MEKKCTEEERNSINKKVIKFIEKNRPHINPSTISIIIEKYIGLNNNNYKIIISDKESNKILDEYFLKIFKNRLDNKKLESDVQKILGEKDLGPKVLELNDEEKYRFDEFLPNISYIEFNICLDENIIENILKIILGFNNLYHFCHYNIDNNYKISYIENKSIMNKNKEIISIDFDINSFNQHINEYLPKGIIVLNKFIEDYNVNKNIINLDNKIKNLKNYVDNYKSILVEEIYKHEGYFIFSHSDFHRGNVVHMGNNFDKLFVLDNEFVNLNLLGYDLIYYLVKSVFNHGIVENYFDLSKFYKIYLKYINKFLNEFNGFKVDDNNIDNNNLINAKNYVEKIASSKEYFLRLVKLVLFFDIIYCCDLINFENEFVNKKPIFGFFDYLYLNIEILKKIEVCDISKI